MLNIFLWSKPIVCMKKKKQRKIRYFLAVKSLFKNELKVVAYVMKFDIKFEFDLDFNSNNESLYISAVSVCDASASFRFLPYFSCELWLP